MYVQHSAPQTHPALRKIKFHTCAEGREGGDCSVTPSLSSLAFLHPTVGDACLHRGRLHDSIGVIFRSFIISAGKSWGSILQIKWSSINVWREKDQDLNSESQRCKNLSEPRWSSSTSRSALKRRETEIFPEWSLEAWEWAKINSFYCVLV